MKMTKALLASCLFMAAPLMAADYDVDAAHTTVQFKVGHLGFSELVGRFNTFSGTFSMDDANPAAAKARRLRPFLREAAASTTTAVRAPTEAR